jgi:hypothetical protein
MVKEDSKKEEEGEILDDVLSDEEVSTEKEGDKEEDKEDKEEDEEDKEVEDETKGEEREASKESKEEEAKEEESKKDTKEIEERKPAPIAKESKEDVPPPKPARPLTPRQEAVKSLKEAFPTVEDKYITSHLIASSFNLEKAFNALLYLSDPDSVNLDELTADEPAPPSLPQRKELNQLEQDELLAKQLDEEYRNKAQRRVQRQQDARRRRVEGAPLDEDEDEDVFTNFVEKDLPQIKEQFSKNIEETKNKFNTWVSGWKKQYNNTQQELNNRQIKKQVREEFEQDPEELDLQKFHGIKLSDDSEPSTGRSRAMSTDLYGTPKNSQKKEKPEEEDDFNLSDA